MRKITAGLFISVNGVVENPHEWHFPYANDEMGVAVDRQLGSADTVLLGRTTYDAFAQAWPNREDDGGEEGGMAKALGDARKIVIPLKLLSSETFKTGLLNLVYARDPQAESTSGKHHG